jgi:hypothetical protein
LNDSTEAIAKYDAMRAGVEAVSMTKMTEDYD